MSDAEMRLARARATNIRRSTVAYCKRCGGDGLEPAVDDRLRGLLKHLIDIPPYVSPTTGRHGPRTVHGVSLGHAFAKWLQKLRQAEPYVRPPFDLDALAKIACTECDGWGDTGLRGDARLAQESTR